jgi:CheY-like chemotaxis protein
VSPACLQTVMIVDDDGDIREAIAEALGDLSYDVLEAANGEEALTQLRQQQGHRPCVILLDIMMPVMDGWQFRNAQRNDPTLADIPVVVLSAHASIAEAANDMAVKDVLRKPVRLDTLIEAVARYCG